MKKIDLGLIVAACILLSISSLRADEFQVGMSAIDTEPKIGLPLAGYGSKDRRMPGFIDWQNKYPDNFFFRPSVGTHTPIRAKAMAIQNDETTVVFISLDVIGIEHRFLRDLAKRFKKQGIPEKNFILSGTHTHSGPGTLSNRLPLQLVAVDLYKRKNYLAMLDKVTEAVQEALNRREPADVYKSAVQINGVQRNKFRFKDIEHYDKTANFLLAKSKTSGHWLGGMVNFSVHGGGMPSEIMEYSSDFPGQIEINLEKSLDQKNNGVLKTVMLFMNGAEGDVGVKHATGGKGETVENIEHLGRVFGAQAEVAFEPKNMIPVEPILSVKRQTLRLGNTAGSSMKWCIGGSLFSWMPAQWRIPYFALFPTKTRISQVTVGDVLIMTWPGEASSALGWALQDQARQKGAKDPWFFGLTNDYMTYFTTKAEFFEGAYDSCSSLFTWKGGERILRAHSQLQD